LTKQYRRFHPYPQRCEVRALLSKATTPLSRAIVTSLIVALAYGSGVVAEVRAQPIQPDSTSTAPSTSRLVVGVVQSPDNADQWTAIVERLEVADIAYRVIDWQQVGQNTVFADVTILFLPDVEEITSGQVLALQNWINRGGGVIVSGPTGRNASSGVQRSLQSLFGAYWVSALSEPVRLQPTVLNSQRWLREGDTDSQIMGGSLVPTDLASQSVATWGNVQSTNSSSSAARTDSATNTVAIVTTRQTVFLGWRWGNAESSSIDFDSRWLRAALSRFEVLPPVIAAPAPASAQTPTVQAPVAPARATSEPVATERTATQPPMPPRSTSPPRLLPPLPPAAPDRQLGGQSAPPGLRVEPGAAPITIVDSIAMQRELENLIGRFESALLAASSAEVDLATMPQPKANEDENAEGGLLSETRTESEWSEQGLTASTTDGLLPIAAERQVATGLDNPILQEVRQKQKAFADLLRQQDYAAAREQWLQARQLLWDNFPTDRAFAPTEIRAVWLDRETIVAARSRQGLARIFDRLAAAGINTVFFETVNAGFPIYPSRVAPQQNPLTRQWDPLEAAVELAHERGMELHAWVWTFAVGNEAHNRVVNLPLAYPGPIVSEHPDWASYDRQGNLILAGQEEAFLDPANPAARRYLLQLFEEIVTRYDVDGLQLDYIRYPFQSASATRTQGYGRAARQQFQQRTGVDPITLLPERDRELWQQWTEFRVSQINSFIAETSELVRRLDSDLILSAAVFSMPTQERIQKIQQNWEVWAQQGDVDMIVVMTYATDTDRLQQLATPWLTEATVDLGDTLVLPGILLLDLPDQAAFDQIQALRDLPSGGYALFAMAHLHDNLQGMLHRTQGTNASDAIPYRQPLTAAADRFASLQREWNFLLNRDQLWMREHDLQDWQTQTEALQAAFAELADNPSDRQLQKTQELLQTFQANFDSWMYSQSLTQTYRVQTWKHRLVTIANLLDYGSRTAVER